MSHLLSACLLVCLVLVMILRTTLLLAAWEPTSHIHSNKEQA